MKLIIGNKRYSSWSLRPWVLMRHFDIHFDELLIPLDQSNTFEEISKFSPSGKVPALIDGDLTVWDSLAIAEYLHEKFPDRKMWPEERSQRAVARSVASEMHSGFQIMREIMSHDLQKELTNFDYSAAQGDISRVQEIWSNCLESSGGPFLFGEFSIADAMFAPVVNRLISYGVKTDSNLQDYIRIMRTLPAHMEWIRAAKAETLRVPRYE